MSSTSYLNWPRIYANMVKDTSWPNYTFTEWHSVLRKPWLSVSLPQVIVQSYRVTRQGFGVEAVGLEKWAPVRTWRVSIKVIFYGKKSWMTSAAELDQGQTGLCHGECASAESEPILTWDGLVELFSRAALWSSSGQCLWWGLILNRLSPEQCIKSCFYTQTILHYLSDYLISPEFLS